MPWSSAQWDDRLCVAIGYARHGWVQIALISAASGRSALIQCSDVYPPFDALLRWLHQLAGAQLLAALTIDEESVFISLCAQATEYGTDAIDLTVFEHDMPEALFGPGSEPLLHCRVSRLGLVHEFASRLERWLAEDYEPAEFGGERPDPTDPPLHGDLRRLDLAALWAQLPAGRARPPSIP